MAIFDETFKEIFASQMVSVLVGLLAGTLLAIYTDKLFLIPGMLILLPGFLEMRGNISGSLAARLTSGMFLGFIKPNRMKTKIIKGNIMASFILAISVSLFLGLIAFLFNFMVFGIVIYKIILIPLIAGIIANAIEVPLTFCFTVYFFRKGYDPGNIMGPFVTSTGDVTSILSLLLVVAFI